jgi:hypothetical protein
MILELIEEINPGTGTMYAVRTDDSTIKWFAKREDAEVFYDAILADINILKKQKNVLKSKEIDVSLES